MNLPFSFALTNTNIYGILWNPWGTVVANSVANGVLANLNADLQERYGLLITSAMLAQLTGFSIMADTAGGECQLGIWDTDQAAFNTIYPSIYPLKVVDGVFTRVFAGSGLCLPVGAKRLPAVKLVGAAATVNISGDLDLILCRDFGLTAGPNIPVPDSNLLAEDGTAITAETLAPLRTG